MEKVPKIPEDRQDRQDGEDGDSNITTNLSYWKVNMTKVQQLSVKTAYYQEVIDIKLKP